MTRLPTLRLRTVLLAVNLMILMLPLGLIATLRLYENELIHRTEAELVAQGAIVREAYRRLFREQLASTARPRGTALTAHGKPLDAPPTSADGGLLAPIPPRIDASADDALPPAPDAVATGLPPDRLAAMAGRELTPILRRAGQTTLAGIRVTDCSGIVVASTRGEIGMSIAGREEVAGALAGSDVALLRERISDEPRPPLESISRGKRHRVFVALPVIEADHLIGTVVLSRTPLDISKALYLNRRPVFLGAGVLLVVVVLVSLLTSVTINRPVRALMQQAKAIADGKQSALRPATTPGTREIEQLSEAIANMAEHLERRADYIRTFASHVSHEFKTPLAAIRGAVELLEDHGPEMTPQERLRFVGNIGQAVGRLERLVGRLLELARADVLRPGSETIDCADAIAQISALASERGLDLEVRDDTGPATLTIGPEILTEVFANLLDNAVQHGGPRPEVCLDTRRQGQTVELVFADDGAGVSSANAEKVFTPFFTTARESGGSGLGLTIVRALLDAHGGAIDLLERERGAAFRLRIPCL